jgi:hemolysin activation/secretion protein
VDKSLKNGQKPVAGPSRTRNLRSIAGGKAGIRVGLAALLVSFAGAGQAFAQQADLSERIAQQQRERIEELNREAARKQAGDPVIVDEAVRRELPPKGGPTVKLNSVTFDPPSAFLTDAELEAIRSKFVGKTVDFSEISELVRDVNDLYAEKGIVTAAAILPPQELSNGELKIQLVEGQLGNVALVGDHKTRNGYILNRIRLAKGTTVDVPTAAKDLNFFNKTNQAQLRLLLRPGAAFGVTDLVLGITEPKANELQFFLDNEGTKSTGEYQASAYYRHYGALGLDDTFSFYGSLAEGSASGTLRYDLPVTPWGTRLNLGYTQSSTTVVDGPTAVLDIDGRGVSGTVSLSQPIYVDQKLLLLATASAFLGENYSASAGVPLVDSRTVKYAPGLALNYTNGNFNFTGQMQLVFAEVDDHIAVAVDDYLVGTGSLSMVYRFADEQTALLAAGGWQYTNDTLLPGNLLFQIGGPTTVRGYPSDGIAGDSGYYANFELHRSMGDEREYDLFGFADIGSVFSTFPSQQNLASVGVGVNYTYNKHVSLKLTAAAPVLKTLSDQPDLAIYGALTWRVF